MKILIIGGTGSMGAALVELLSKTEHSVYVTSRTQHPSSGNIHYILGDGKDISFVESLGLPDFDGVVDFMKYSTQEFRERLDLLLSAKHYVFLSTARVYADAPLPLTEESPRLLEVSEDKEYLATDEYALAKARQEDLLHSSEKGNYTIIRPCTTYNVHRLQLGVYEKEHWLYRALQGKTVVFSRDIANSYTTMTAAKDVAAGIYRLLGDARAHGETFQLAAPHSLRWSEMLDIYASAFEEVTGSPLKVQYVEKASELYSVLSRYQVELDRLYDRKFDSSKADAFFAEKIDYTRPEVGMREALLTFLNGDREFRQIKWESEALMDRLTQQRK